MITNSSVGVVGVVTGLLVGGGRVVTGSVGDVTGASTGAGVVTGAGAAPVVVAGAPVVVVAGAPVVVVAGAPVVPSQDSSQKSAYAEAHATASHHSLVARASMDTHEHSPVGVATGLLVGGGSVVTGSVGEVTGASTGAGVVTGSVGAVTGASTGAEVVTGCGEGPLGSDPRVQLLHHCEYTAQ